MTRYLFLLALSCFLGAVYLKAEEVPAAGTETAPAVATESPAPPAEKEYPEIGLTAEAGIAMAGGNTRSATYTVKADNKWIWTKDILKANGQYYLSNAATTSGAALTKTGENWALGARYERTISGKFGAYAGNSWEGNRFAGYAYRTNVDAGFQYYLIEGDRKDNYLVTEFGYRFSSEDRKGIVGATVATFTAHALRFYIEAIHKLTPSVSARAYVEVLPDMSDGQNLLINFEPSLSVILTDNLSLKLAFNGKFDGLPAVPANKKFDYLYTTSLVTTF